MAAAVRVVAVDFDLLPRDRYVFVILAPHRPPLAIMILDGGRVAVRHVAARFGRLVRHEPGRVEPLMQRHVLRRMMPMLLLRDGLSSSRDEKADSCAGNGGEKCNGQSAGKIPHIEASMLQSEIC